MSTNPLSFPSEPDGIRTFQGYRRDGLSREEFLSELGSTFMPGTPLMQAPLGLWAYLPAVLDVQASTADYPDEVAIIVYFSRAVYDAKRNSSLSRRMYTHSHTAVFDMQRSSGQFPSASGELVVAAGKADAWYLADAAVDWQAGHTRIAFVVPPSRDPAFPSALRGLIVGGAGELREHGCDQIVTLATDNYAALWMHWDTEDPPPLSELELLPPSTIIERDLLCQRAVMRGDDDVGVEISGAAAFSFIFSRDLNYSSQEVS